jgi:hypothetical protein
MPPRHKTAVSSSELTTEELKMISPDIAEAVGSMKPRYRSTVAIGAEEELASSPAEVLQAFKSSLAGQPTA